MQLAFYLYQGRHTRTSHLWNRIQVWSNHNYCFRTSCDVCQWLLIPSMHMYTQEHSLQSKKDTKLTSHMHIRILHAKKSVHNIELIQLSWLCQRIIKESSKTLLLLKYSHLEVLLGMSIFFLINLTIAFCKS